MNPELRAASPARLHAGVAALAVAETVSWGILFYAFGVLLPAMEADLGVGRAALTAVFSGALLASGLAAPWAGRWLDRAGPRRVMTCGALAAAVLVAGWSRAPGLVELAVIWLGIGITHTLVLYEPAFAVLTRWFPETRARSRALLVVTLLGGLASTVFIPLTGALLVDWGWRGTVMILAAVLALATIPLHASLPAKSRGSPARHTCSSRPRRNAPPMTRSFRWLRVAFALQSLIPGALAVHAVPLLTEAGRMPENAAWFAGLFGVFQVSGRLVVHWWATRWPETWRLPGLLALQAAAVASLAFAGSDLAAWVFAFLFGTSNGLLTLARPLVVAEWSDSSDFGAASGQLAAWTQCSRALAPLLAGGLYRMGDGYGAVVGGLFLAGVASVFAGRIAWTARREEIVGETLRPPAEFGVSRFKLPSHDNTRADARS